MNKELYSLLNSNKGKEVSEGFINDAFDIMMKHEDLSEFIKGFEIKEDIEGQGEYEVEKRIIRVNPKEINNSIIDYKDNNVFALQVLRHEIEHAKNLKRLYEGRHDIESCIIQFSLIDHIRKNKLGFRFFMDETDEFLLNFRIKENYLYDPGERIADIKSHKFIVNLLKNQRISEELLQARILLYYSYIRGYKDNGIYLDAPTYTFLSNLGLFREQYLLKKTVDDTGYSLDTRVLCGLPITYNERDNVLLKKVRLQRRK